MGSHINSDGKFQSDKYPTCPAGKVPLSVEDETAQDLLFEYAQRRRDVDAEFSDDLETALATAGYDAETHTSVDDLLEHIIRALHPQNSHTDTVSYLSEMLFEEYDIGEPEINARNAELDAEMAAEHAAKTKPETEH